MSIFQKKNMKRISNSITLITLAAIMTSCIHIERSPESGHANNDESQPTGPLTSWAARSVRQNLEMNLRTKEEMDLYSQVSPWFWSDDEAVDFLSQPNAVQKQRWIQNKNIARRPASLLPKVKKAVDNEDVMVGMPQDLVLQSWGDPQKKEVAGNPAFRNERWKYEKFVPTPDGFKREIRTVYFEGGRVSGWTTENPQLAN